LLEVLEVLEVLDVPEVVPWALEVEVVIEVVPKGPVDGALPIHIQSAKVVAIK